MSGGDWISRICDRVEQHVNRTKGAGASIVCSSGISPSGPIHLGNLREVMTVHLVVEELRARGRDAEHIHVWDDYDRLRKVPAGIDPAFAQYLGQPLSLVPDPYGECASYAARYINLFERELAALQIFPRYIRQSVAYREGRYTGSVIEAMRQRGEIFDVLAEYQTAVQESEQERAARRAVYYPFRVYCEQCHRDTTSITTYVEDTAALTYECQTCGYNGGYSLQEKTEGKLVWKVDWPMRWSMLQVDFEPAGEDHSAPGSSFTVGQRLVRDVYHAPAPQYANYAFVGMDGRTKISSSAGTTATISTALEILEPAMLRWMYARRANTQPMMLDFGQGLPRLYDEWDTLARQVEAGKANAVNLRMYERAIRTTHGEVLHTQRQVPFSLLTSLSDVTQGNIEQIMRIVAQLPGAANVHLEPQQLEPRLTCAMNWINNFLPDDERTTIRATFDDTSYNLLSTIQRRELAVLVERLDGCWNLAELTELVYNVPKLVLGLPLDAATTEEMKQAQRAFFVAIYTLICGSDTGPRIPTLLLSLGKERVKALLTPHRQAVTV